MKFNKTQNLLIEKFNKIAKPLVRLIQKKRKQFINTENERGSIITDFTDSNRIIRDYGAQLSINSTT